jgi:hypothetical protein
MPGRKVCKLWLLSVALAVLLAALTLRYTSDADASESCLSMIERQVRAPLVR